MFSIFLIVSDLPRVITSHNEQTTATERTYDAPELRSLILEELNRMKFCFFQLYMFTDNTAITFPSIPIALRTATSRIIAATRSFSYPEIKTKNGQLAKVSFCQGLFLPRSLFAKVQTLRPAFCRIR